ncbi:MAG: ZPR1 zinc finger domain-containing protein [Methanomicrobiales archaeon]|nr:ZPR1 zinc finger domain-containing protein [Methanomicrobiales archaeon]MDI6876727.1 ZPR1 zinc finger domain-containing protein [Methanomicrobiales archaeon]
MRSVLQSRCPICENEIEFLYQTEEIPYFSKVLLVSGSCPCGFRYTDTMILEENEPSEWAVRVEAVEDLSIRVIRSACGHLEIPELGVLVEPGPICQGFVSNVEGVLDRVGDVLAGVLSWAEGEERERATNLLLDLDEVRAGALPITLIVRDPTGNSAIVSDKAERRLLEAEECGP